MAALLVFCMLLQEPEIPKKYADAAAGIELPKDLESWKEKSPQHRKAIEVVADRATWARGLQRIDEKLGLFTEKPQIKVVVAETAEPRPAKGSGKGGTGEIHFNIAKLVEYIRAIEEIERIQREDDDVQFAVPPTPLASLIHHELVHCFTGTFEEAWLTEGLATYTAEETAHLWDFQHRNASAESLDKPMTERDAYARGYCAIAWLGDKYGAEKLKAFVKLVVGDEKAVREGLELATEKKWEVLAAEELDWTREFLEKNFTPKK